MKKLRSFEEQELSRICFEMFPDWSYMETLPDPDQYVLKWWFESWNDENTKPPLSLRMKVFFQRASVDEILFPGKPFESFLIGLKHRKESTSIILSIIARVASYLLFFIIWSCLLVVFIAGCLSFGLLWPSFMRETLFLEAVY